MSAFPSQPRSKLPVAILLVVVVIAAIAGGAWFLGPRFESDPPQITLSPNSDFAGQKPLEIRVTDAGTGLKTVTIIVTQGGADQTLAYAELNSSREKTYWVALGKVKELTEGPAVLKVVARDSSFWHTFAGNTTTLEKNITIDTTPPALELVADDRYVDFGGVGAIVYKTSADTAASGVRMGEAFFPGFPGQVQGHPDHYLALFAHPYNMPPDARPMLVATDKAGNTREMRISYELKNVKYKKSTIALSERFLQDKVAPLLADAAARQGTPQEMFVAVNKKLRKENEDKITEVTKRATPRILWKDAFTQLSNSKVEANFADQRTYTYNGQPVDTAYHLGYDLSVTKHYPVEAANSGAVTFAGPLGIYGNAVILDHGLGLFSLYGHLSQVDVKVGDSVVKRQPLGRSGETGLAAGDHLHFGMYLDGVAILPVEWWDPKWIAANIAPKLAGEPGAAIAEAQPARGSRGSQAKHTSTTGKSSGSRRPRA